MVETDQAGGGILPVLGGFVGGAIGSFIASYAYEKAGGAAGIEKALTDAWNAYVAAVATRQQICRETGLACSIGGL